MNFDLLMILLIIILSLIIIIAICIYHLVKSNKYLQSIIKIHEDKFVDLENNIIFHQNFFIQYEKIKNEKFEINNKKNESKSYLLLLSFSTKIKNIIIFIRIVVFRKIANILLLNITNKYANILRKTAAKFTDKLKPKDNSKKFSIIYCPKYQRLEDIDSSLINITIDFLMFIHDYSSNKIHLNKITNAKEIIKIIDKKNEDNLDENIEINTNGTSFKSEELINYIFNEFDIEKETKEIIDSIKDKDNKDVDIKNEENKKDEENNDNKNEINLEKKEEEQKKEENKEDKKKKKKKKKKREEKEDKTEEKKEGEIKEKKEIEIKEKKGKKKEIEIKERKEKEEKERKEKEEKEKKEEEEKKERMFENFKKKHNLNLIAKENDLELIKECFFKGEKKGFNINELIELYNKNLEDITEIKNKYSEYENKILNYDYTTVKEYYIETIFDIYKLHFNKDSEIYQGIEVEGHYRFNASYKKLIDIKKINEIKLTDIKETVIKLSGNNLIDIISEDKGKFGDNLKIEDI